MVLNWFKKQDKIELYNTLSRQKEVFKPIKSGQVSFYQCGPTVYWTQHIGNLRAAVLSDLIRRTFTHAGYKVNFVRNYTDVGHLTGDNLGDADSGEDRMEKGAKREGLTPAQIAEKYIKLFETDVHDLNIREPNTKPKATDYIPAMITLVQDLLKKGFAYSTDLAVYFDISKAKDYTKLSGQKIEENIKGAGAGDITDPQKKNAQDFALWFFKAGTHANALQTWDSPMGQGFPGWHIECSAMIKKLLGKTIDIHMGGIEHIPVHHTNEIAQSESANNAPLAHYWLHNEWLLANGAKMAKSEGTAYSLAEVKEKGFSPLALRYFFLQAHYRSKQNFTWEALQASATGYERLLKSVSALGTKVGKIDKTFRQNFLSKIGDDFNSPQALAVISDLLKSSLSNADKKATILDFDKVLGLDLQKGSDTFKDIDKPVSPEIQKLIDEREIARKNKDWAKADELRAKIISAGFEVKDK